MNTRNGTGRDKPQKTFRGVTPFLDLVRDTRVSRNIRVSRARLGGHLLLICNANMSQRVQLTSLQL
jgi:hypothetical protein